MCIPSLDRFLNIAPVLRDVTFWEQRFVILTSDCSSILRGVGASLRVNA